jgi:hypothetical protein
MKKLKAFYEPTYIPKEVYIQSFLIQLGLFALLILVVCLTALFDNSWGGVAFVMVAVDLIAIIEILFSIIYPFLKRNTISFRNRLIIVALSPGLIFAILFYLSHPMFPGEFLLTGLPWFF